MVCRGDDDRLYFICQSNRTKIHEKSSTIQRQIRHVCVQLVSSFCQRLYSAGGNILKPTLHDFVGHIFKSVQ